MVKKLENIGVKRDNISYTGETRSITITGTPGAQFKLTLTNSSDVSKLNSSAPGYTTPKGKTDTVNGAVSSGVKVVMDNNVVGNMVVGDRVTGNAALEVANVTVAALNPDGDNAKEFSMSEAITLADGVTLTIRPKDAPHVDTVIPDSGV